MIARVGRGGVDRPGEGGRAWRRCCRPASVARTSNGVRARGQPGVALRAGAARPGAAVEPAVERRAGLRRGERERALVRVGRVGRARGDRGVGRRDVDRPGERRRRRISVAGRVGGAHLDGVRAGGERGVRARAVQADQPPPSSWHSKVEPGSVAVNENDAPVAFVGFAGVDVIDVSGAVRSTVQVKLRRAGVGVPDGVGRADVDGVRPRGQPGVALGARAAGPGAAVEPALERGSGLSGGEREAPARRGSSGWPGQR